MHPTIRLTIHSIFINFASFHLLVYLSSFLHCLASLDARQTRFFSLQTCRLSIIPNNNRASQILNQKLTATFLVTYSLEPSRLRRQTILKQKKLDKTITSKEKSTNYTEQLALMSVEEPQSATTTTLIYRNRLAQTLCC